jgi:hypothetical protein
MEVSQNAGEKACAECRRLFPLTEMIHVGNASVCLECKPVFLQKLAEGAKLPSDTQAPIFFPVSTIKLVALSLATLNLYHLYWFYKNWALESRRTGEHMYPVLRAMFSPIFAYSLFHRMYAFGGNYTGNVLNLTQTSTQREVVPFSHGPGLLAGLYIVISIGSNLPLPLDLGGLIWPFGVVPLALVQRSVARINQVHAPGAALNRRFSLANILVLIFGGTLALLATVAPFIEE